MERIDKTPHIQTIRIDCKAGTQGDISTELKEMAAQMDSVMISSKSEIKAGVDQLAAAGTPCQTGQYAAWHSAVL